MDQITDSKKYQNGIQVFWMKDGQPTDAFFSYDELVEQKINALDLLNNPRLYFMNASAHQIESAAAGCGFSTGTCEDEIVITRYFDAPRDLAWRAWTEPGLITKWWGPKGYSSPQATIDLREGGSYLFCMRSPEGREIWSTGVIREIRKPDRIVVTDSFADAQGHAVPGTYYGMGQEFPAETILTVSFEVIAGRTKLVLRHAGFPAGEMRDMTRAGWNESLDKYAGVLAQTVFAGTKGAEATSGGGE